MNLTDHYGLRVDAALSDFIEREAIPGTGIDAQSFWQGFAEIVQELAPRNRALLAERDRLQTALDEWHRAHPGPIRDLRAYRAFLQAIGYLVPAPAAVISVVLPCSRPAKTWVPRDFRRAVAAQMILHRSPGDGRRASNW